MAAKKKTHKFDDHLTFELSGDYRFYQEKDDDGNVLNEIRAGEQVRDDGSKAYRTRCRVVEGSIQYQKKERPSPSEVLEMIAKDRQNSRYVLLPGPPYAMIMTVETPVTIFGRVLKTFGLLLMVMVEETKFDSCNFVGTLKDDDPSEHRETFDGVFEVAKAVRVDGQPLNLGQLTSEKLESVLLPSFSGDAEAIDMSPKLQFNITAGDETTTYEYTPDGMKEIGKEKLNSADPDLSLYPHYASIKNNIFQFMPGAVVNATGTEYAFHKFSEMVYTWSSDQEFMDRKPILQKVLDLNPPGYTLHETAADMIGLFRVNREVFVNGHDRESELRQGYMRRAYMMSALRSFAWTLAAYCKEYKKTPKTVGGGVPGRIANFVASRDWLNYDGNSYCKGLCSGSDLHVYFLPNAVTKADRQKFLPTQEDFDRVAKMKERFPAYREILSEVHSLEALRKDLEYIYPAVKVLYDDLAKDRDPGVALEGNESDIVYAWIALAMAADGPFFTEDGPTSYYSEWPGAEDERIAARLEEAERQREEKARIWTEKYGKYVEKNPVISFTGNTFVFSGVGSYHGVEKDDPIVQKVIEKGGEYRSKISGLTNYLVVEPHDAGESKIKAAIEQIEKGKNIKIILLEDLVNVLEGKPAGKKQAKTGTKQSASKKTPTAEDISAAQQNQKKLNNLKKAIDNTSANRAKIAEGQSDIKKYGDYLEQKEEREKEQEKEKARKKAEALAAGKSEKDIVNMYIILTNEKKMGKLRRAQNEFYEIYEEDFAAFTKAEVINTRKEVTKALEDEALCAYYAEQFRKRPVSERFSVSTRNLYNVDGEPEVGVRADWAIENTKEWYTPAEYSEVRRLMDKELADNRKQLDDQLNTIDASWKKFSGAKDFLQLVITDKEADGSDLNPQFSNFQHVTGSQLVSVQLASKGLLRMSTTVMNCLTWYWGVTVRDVWEAAYKNELRDERYGAYNGSQLATQAIGQIRAKYPDTKAVSGVTVASAKPGGTVSAAPSPQSSPAAVTQAPAKVITASDQSAQKPQEEKQQQPPQAAQKEGCYIATAVYGSYDAPQVMVLRRYRDETLRNTAFGRWFIRTYYRLSPPLANRLKTAKHINHLVRSVLDKWVEHLDMNQE